MNRLKSMNTLKSPSITIKSDVLTRFQQYHALTITWLPIAGVVGTLIMATIVGVRTSEIVIFAILSLLTTLGVEVGFHRYFSHSSFKAHPIVRYALAIMGTWSAQGPIIYWVANHRRHHQYSDRPEDVHSPYYQDQQSLSGFQGFWHAHLGWIFGHQITNTTVFAKDLIQDPMIAKINSLYLQILLLGLVIPALINGLWTQSIFGVLTGFLWGGLVRIFWVHQVTFAVNSFCHTYGSRPFKSKDCSSNNFWLALPTLGGSWHNNHHAFPHSAITGLHWWQIDFSGWFIRILEFIGLVTDLKVPSPEMIAAKLQSTQID
jgi:stearoyl-CoA desaturase (delta-9 desaturase)